MLTLTLDPTMGRISQRGTELHVSALLPNQTIRVVIARGMVVSAVVDVYPSRTTRPASQDEVETALAYGDACLQWLREVEPSYLAGCTLELAAYATV